SIPTVAGGIAGVGTFPGWLNLAVAPTSKGLIPRSVSMSRRSVWWGSRTRQGAGGGLERSSRPNIVLAVIGLRVGCPIGGGPAGPLASFPRASSDGYVGRGAHGI